LETTAESSRTLLGGFSLKINTLEKSFGDSSLDWNKQICSIKNDLLGQIKNCSSNIDVISYRTNDLSDLLKCQEARLQAFSHEVHSSIPSRIDELHTNFIGLKRDHEDLTKQHYDYSSSVKTEFQDLINNFNIVSNTTKDKILSIQNLTERIEQKSETSSMILNQKCNDLNQEILNHHEKSQLLLDDLSLKVDKLSNSLTQDYANNFLDNFLNNTLRTQIDGWLISSYETLSKDLEDKVTNLNFRLLTLENSSTNILSSTQPTFPIFPSTDSLNSYRPNLQPNILIEESPPDMLEETLICESPKKIEIENSPPTMGTLYLLDPL